MERPKFSRLQNNVPGTSANTNTPRGEESKYPGYLGKAIKYYDDAIQLGFKDDAPWSAIHVYYTNKIRLLIRFGKYKDAADTLVDMVMEMDEFSDIMTTYVVKNMLDAVLASERVRGCLEVLSRDDASAERRCAALMLMDRDE